MKSKIKEKQFWVILMKKVI